MKIRRIDSSLSAGYGEFLRSEPSTLVYQTLAYQNLLCEMLGARNETVVAYDHGDRICGAVPMLARDGPWGTVCNSLPFYGSNGGVIARDAAARSALVSWYSEFANDANLASCTLITNPLADHATEQVTHNRTDSRIGQLSPIDVGDDADGLMKIFHYKTRNMIRKAEKSGVAISIDNDAISFLRSTHNENLAALGGIPKPATFFDLFPRHFIAGRDYRIYTARIGDEVAAAVLLFYFNRTVEYFMPVILKDFRQQQPMSLLIYTAMIDAARNGYAWWNWGGTWLTQEGVHRFKSRWGTVERPYTYHVQLNRLDLESRSRQEILDAYPYFYVLPFTAAQSG